MAIVKAVIAMAHGLGLTVVAEGVESDDQAVFLAQERCDELQGFLVSPPVPAESFSAMIREQDDRNETLEQRSPEPTLVHTYPS